jgi:hypothetical protein
MYQKRSEKFMATKEFLKALRMKHHLGEFSKKFSRKAKTKRVRVKLKGERELW